MAQILNWPTIELPVCDLLKNTTCIVDDHNPGKSFFPIIRQHFDSLLPQKSCGYMLQSNYLSIYISTKSHTVPNTWTKPVLVYQN